MNFILVSVGNFQEYILICIEQLQKLNIESIYVITNKDFFHFFEGCKGLILIDTNDLQEEYNFYNRTGLNKTCRGGFWALASQRFFIILALMKKYDLHDCFHCENDVLLYYSPQELLSGHLSVDKGHLYVPFDCYNRTVASIMYIPTYDIFKTILDKYDINRDDMSNFCRIKIETGLIENFPIFPQEFCISDEEKFVSNNFDKFNNYVFDAAAIGQFLGGVDPRNISGDSTGFVNETCVIKYDKYCLSFEELDGIRRPFMEIGGKKYPIFNLHIHCKNLSKFV